MYIEDTLFLTGERPSVTAVPSDWNNVRQCLMSRVGGVSRNKNGDANQWRTGTNFKLLLHYSIIYQKSKPYDIMSP